MDDLATRLMLLGFGEYEARAYIALLQKSPVNGYELAKASGIPRANIYAVLQKLVERGAAARVDTPDAARYAPTPPDELLRRLESRFQETLAATQRDLQALVRPVEHAAVWNMQGYPVLLEHARALISGAQGRLLVTTWPPEAQALAATMAQAEGRGVEITTLCLAACTKPCGGCRGNLYRYRVVATEEDRWLVLVVDGEELLVGEVGANDESVAARTRQRLLVTLTSWFIRHSIALATVLNDLGTQLEPLLDPATRETLATLGPEGTEGDWLTHMRDLLRPPEP